MSNNSTDGRHHEDRIELLLDRMRDGQRAARDELYSLIYEEIRRDARRALGTRSWETLRATALAHETFLKLAKKQCSIVNKRHLFWLVHRVMWDIIIDYQRKLGKRRGRVSLEPDHWTSVPLSDNELEAWEALKRLEQTDPVAARLISLHEIEGWTHDEVAEEVQISKSTVRRKLRTAKLYLGRWLRT